MYLTKGTWWPVFEKTQFVEEITFHQIADFSKLFRSHLTMTLLIAGNMTAEVMMPSPHNGHAFSSAESDIVST